MRLKPIENSGQEIINFAPSLVHEAGVQRCTWPSDIEGLMLEPVEEQLALNGLIRISITTVIETTLNARVTEFDPGKRIMIKGQNALAAASLLFLLDNHDTENSTVVKYGLRVHPSLAIKPLVPKLRATLNEKVPHFAANYSQNVNDYLARPRF